MSTQPPSSRPEESVWDYQRPPKLELVDRQVEIRFADTTIVQSTRCLRVLETSHPPVYYIPPDDILDGVLVPTDRTSICEWKGVARYFHVVVNEFSADRAAWGYEQTTQAFRPLRDHVAFYAHLMDGCFVDGERVQAQAGGFYGGWITSEILGPFKGPPGTLGW